MKTRIALTALLVFLSVSAFAEKAQPVVNINTATETQLMYLPGIGPVLAGRIVEFIEGVDTGERREITDKRDLLLIKGISAKKYERLLPYVVLTGPTTATGKIKTAGRKDGGK